MFETIVALATPPLKSALAIIRLSGDDCFEIVSKCFSKDITKLTKRDVLFGHIIDGEQKIDDVVLIAYRGPKSFTGEDSVEIVSHGSILIAKQIIELLIKNGARIAKNGEFTSRAFMNQKIDLIQAEAINDIINANTIESKSLSMLSLDGKTSNKIYPIKKRIADVVSLIEVNIDYPEYEDIEIANKKTIIYLVDELVPQINLLICEGKKAQIIRDGINVAIVGKPNVGKSSLLNAFLKEEKAIVTDVPGTTRDVVEGEVNLDGITLHLLDTAGIRNTDNIIENIGIKKSEEIIKKADVILAIIDNSKTLDKEDEKILKETESCSRRIVVLNKSDLGHNSGIEGIEISALNKSINPLVQKIKTMLGIDEKVFSTPALNNARQLGLLSATKESLLKAKEDAKNDLTMDLISVSLMNAYISVLEILGEANQADLAKEIFSRFCVGK